MKWHILLILSVMLLAGSKPVPLPLLQSEPGSNDSILIEKYTREMLVTFYELEILTEPQRDSVLSLNGIDIVSQQVIYSPDRSFKLFVITAYLCKDFMCQTVTNSYVHYNLEAKEKAKQVFLLPVTAIHKLDDKYLVLGEWSGRSTSSGTPQTCFAAQLVSFEQDEFIMHEIAQPGNSSRELVFCYNSSEEVDYYLKFTTGINLLEYRFKDIYSDSIHLGEMRYLGGKFLIQKDSAWFHKSIESDQEPEHDWPSEPQTVPDTTGKH